MKVHQFFLHNQLRNFNYLVETEKYIFCIDPFDTDLLIQKIKDIGKPLCAIINTHEHWDHVAGNDKIKSEFNVPLWCHENAQDVIANVDKWFSDEEFFLDGNDKLIFKKTPGHTMSHMCLYLESHNKLEGIIVGDTVFVAGVGNCHNGGDPAVLFETIDACFKNLDKDVCLYPSHDYAQTNLKFTLSIDPNNKEAKAMLDKIETAKIDTTKLVTTIDTECKVNCFFRYEDLEVKKALKLHQGSNKNVFIKLRELRNQW